MPYFLEAFNAIADTKSVPSEILRASISVIPNQAKTLYIVYIYQNQSNQNERHHATSYPLRSGRVYSIQRGNTIRTLNIIASAKKLNTPLMLLSTDAEKAFDSRLNLSL